MTKHEHDHSNCRQLLGSLSEYIDGDLDEALCIEIEAHMADCENCRVVVDTLRKTVLLYHALPEEPLPEAVAERLFRRLDLEDFLSA